MKRERRKKERESSAREGTFRRYLYASSVLGYERLALGENLVPDWRGCPCLCRIPRPNLMDLER